MIEIRHRAVVDGGSIEHAYNDLYRERKLLMRDSFYLWLLEVSGARPGDLLVDVACGNGRLVQLAAARGVRAVGLDLALAGIVDAARASQHAQWIVGDGQCLPIPDGCADVVMSIGSLEHYANPTEGVVQLARIAKPDGLICVLLPNAFGALGNIRHVLRSGEVFDDEQPIQRYATRRTWEMMLQKGGVHIDRIVPYGEFNRPRTVSDLIWSAVKPQKYIKGALAKLAPLNLANHFVFLCRPTASTPTLHYPMLSY
ncbi:class I SAM-dependent methyltransferase [Caldilinea sp.]|uniref:class I SAM-dependent methyltransferase n=1 Tax=Caldilinea sp. TaxID=2293560 RepID=UPI002C9A44AF|nr:class I SAM-dependent methyltransferase [Caldilinea sp.]